MTTFNFLVYIMIKKASDEFHDKAEIGSYNLSNVFTSKKSLLYKTCDILFESVNHYGVKF